MLILYILGLLICGAFHVIIDLDGDDDIRTRFFYWCATVGALSSGVVITSLMLERALPHLVATVAEILLGACVASMGTAFGIRKSLGIVGRGLSFVVALGLLLHGFTS